MHDRNRPLAGIAALGDLLPGAVQIEDRRRRLVPMEFGEQRRQRRLELAARQDHLADGLVVGGAGKRPADMHVVRRRDLGVDLVVEGNRRILRHDAEPVHLRQRLIGLRRLVLAGHGQFARRRQGPHGGLVIGHEHAHFVDRRVGPALVVVLVGLDDHAAAALPAIQHIGPGAGDIAGQEGLAVIAALIGPDGLGIDDHHRRHRRQERRIGLVQREAHRTVVDRLHRAVAEHVGEQIGRPLVEAQQAFDRIDHVLGGDRAAVGEHRVAAQGEGEHGGIRRHLPAFGKLRNDLATGIDGHQPVIEVHRRHVLGVVVDLGRIDGSDDLHHVHGHDIALRRRRRRGNGQRRASAHQHRCPFHEGHSSPLPQFY